MNSKPGMLLFAGATLLLLGSASASEGGDTFGGTPITGGITDNLPRILPKGLGAEIETASIKAPPIFKLIQEKGNIARDEMFRTFNMGVGMILVAAKKDAEAAMRELEKNKKTKPYAVGFVVKGSGIVYG